VLDEYIAVAFTVSPNIRKIQFHDPDQLSAWDKFFKTQNTAEGLLPDGQPLVNAKAALARSVTYLPAGETTSIEIEVDEGTVVGSCPLGRAAIMVSIVGAPASGPQVMPVAYGDKALVHDVHEMAPGKIVFTLANNTSERGMFAIAVLPPGFDMGGVPVHFVPFLNGKRLLTTQPFTISSAPRSSRRGKELGSRTSRFCSPISKGQPHSMTASATSTPSPSSSGISICCRTSSLATTARSSRPLAMPSWPRS
jgi:hypothetical protein